jgi:hypothetical protein
MRRSRLFAVSCALVLGGATATAAQPLPPAASDLVIVEPLTPEQDRELDEWLSALEKWQRYEAKYRNRPARDSMGRIVPRRPRPADPEWLPAYCASAAALGVVNLQERIAKACRLLVYTEPGPGAVRAQTQAARDDAEKPDKYSSFLRRIHIDGLWVTTSSGPRVYGIIGSHITLVDVGRVQIFGPPGVLLLSVPDVGNERRLTLGYTWGMSLRLGDVRLLSPTKNMTLFLTMSKVWVSGSNPEQTTAQNFQIAGFSLAPRRKR